MEFIDGITLHTLLDIDWTATTGACDLPHDRDMPFMREAHRLGMIHRVIPAAIPLCLESEAES